MDHIPTLSSSSRKPHQVSYLCQTNTASAGCFWQYPERLGWDRNRLTLGLENKSYTALQRAKKNVQRASPKDIAALLQAWWYFGMLSEVLQVDIKHADFLEAPEDSREQRIVTHELELHLQSWFKRLSQIPRQQAFRQLEKAMKCVEYVHKAVESLGKCVEQHLLNNLPPKARQQPLIAGMRETIDGRISVSDSTIQTIINLANRKPTLLSQEEAFLGQELAYWSINGRKLLPEVLELSICILGFTLSHAISAIYTKLGLEELGQIKHTGWYTPTWVRRQMILDGFCPRLVHRMQTRLLLLGVYLSSLLRLEPEVPVGTSHSDCAPERCNSDHMADNVSSRRHARPNCQCRDLPEIETLEQVGQILEAGKVPVLRLCKSESSSKLKVEVMDSSSQPYTAISHVWSDGLGNPDANEIHACQWLRLQQLVDHMFPQDYKGVSTPFWLDTICVPAAPKGFKENPAWPNWERRKRLRDVAINNMRATYSEAKSILILDSSLMNLKGEDLSNIELGLRFSISKWMRRLWTMHEGAVAAAHRAFLQLKDGCVRLTSISNILVDAVEKNKLASTDLILSSMGAIEAIGAWRGCLHVGQHHNQDLFRFAWNESRDRGTKYAEDRYVVIASMLGVKQPQQLYGYDDPTAQVEFLFTHAPGIPAMILFTSGPRNQRQGFRWAPASIEVDKIDYVMQLEPARRTSAGLVVDFEGIRLERHLDYNRRYSLSRQWVKIEPRADGGDVGSVGHCAWAMEVPGRDGTVEYSTVNFRTENHEAPLLFEHDQLAIVLQPNMQKSKQWTKAVLVAEQKQENGTIFARYIAALWCIHVTTEGMGLWQQGIDLGLYELVKATRYGLDGALQTWCID